MPKAILVDNNPRTRGFLGDLLTHTLNINVKSYDFVHVNIPIIKYFCPNLLFIAQPYPDLIGVELIKEIKNDKELCKIPIIVMLASFDKDFLNIIAKLGITEILKKPYNNQIITNQIATVIDKITFDENNVTLPNTHIDKIDKNFHQIISNIPDVINRLFINNYNNRVQFDFSNSTKLMENVILIKNTYNFENKVFSTSLIATFSTIDRLLSNMDEKDAIDVFIKKANTLFDDLNKNIIKLFLFDGYSVKKDRYDSAYLRKLEFSENDINFFFKNDYNEKFCYSMSFIK